MRTTISNWTFWYVEELDNKVKCWICRDNFTKKNARMLNHLRYICSTGKKDNNVRLCKNMKPNVAHAFCGCTGVALAPLEPAKLWHLHGSAQKKESICQGTRSSTI